jgi:LacI family transcriptional regulator, galactose operon repressor
MRHRRPVTLKDVAAQARVHPGTASRALHPATRHMVRPGTARRVLRAAEALGYVRNHAAASLRTQSTATVGVLLPDIADPLAGAFARGLEDQLATAGYVALTASTDGDAVRERAMLTVMQGRHLDGLVLAGYPARAALVGLASRTGLPQYHVGIQVATLLLERIADPGAPGAARLLPPELIVRCSTARSAPRRSATRSANSSRRRPS